MKPKPILFNSEMVRAILEGRKTQTRRLVKPKQPETSALLINLYTGAAIELAKAELLRCHCPYEIGDKLWVRESFSMHIIKDAVGNFHNSYIYKADFTSDYKMPLGWKPSIHMPFEAARIFLEVTDRRVELLHDISERDAIAEGVLYYGDECKDYKNYLYDNKYGDDWGVLTAKESFQTLFESINGSEIWDLNPAVFAYTFKQVENY